MKGDYNCSGLRVLFHEKMNEILRNEQIGDDKLVDTDDIHIATTGLTQKGKSNILKTLLEEKNQNSIWGGIL